MRYHGARFGIKLLPVLFSAGAAGGAPHEGTNSEALTLSLDILFAMSAFGSAIAPPNGSRETSHTIYPELEPG